MSQEEEEEEEEEESKKRNLDIRELTMKILAGVYVPPAGEKGVIYKPPFLTYVHVRDRDNCPVLTLLYTEYLLARADPKPHLSSTLVPRRNP
jgi:hypothetical protein